MDHEYRDIAENLPHAVWETDAQGRTTYQSRSWFAYVGSRQDPGGDAWATHLHPDDREAALRQWRAALASAGAQRYDVEVRIRRHDGAYRWFRVQGNPVHDDAGRVVKWVGTCADIEAQRARATRVDMAARAAGLGIFEWDLEKRVAIDENDRMHEILGHDGAAPLGPDGVRSRLHRDDAPLFEETLRQASGQRTPWRIRVRAWRDAEKLVLAEFSGHVQGEAMRPRTIGALVEVGGAAPVGLIAPSHVAARPFRGGLSAEQFRRVVEHMERNLDGDVTLEQLARLAGFSPFHFQRAFKRQTGTTPQGYLLQMRVQRAKNLLFGTAMPLTDIANAVGYGTSQAFARAFARAETITPAEFRKRMRG